MLVMGVPSHGFRSTLELVAEHLRAWVPVVSLTKGLEQGSRLRMTEVVNEVLPGHPYGVLTGPNLAKEILAGDAAAAVLAMSDATIAGELQTLFATHLFRVYTNPDVVGCEVAGALKNVMAIASGMADGLGTGDNTRAAVITRGLGELTRLGVAMGGEAITFSGLAGMGDLVATCISTQSRNRYVGEQLGSGRTIDEIIDEMNMVAEGVKTASVVMELAEQYGVEMPIAEQVYAVINEGRTAAEAYKGLLGRRVPATSCAGLADAATTPEGAVSASHRRLDAGWARSPPRPAAWSTPAAWSSDPTAAAGRSTGGWGPTTAGTCPHTRRRCASAWSATTPVVETAMRIPGGDAVQRVYAIHDHGPRRRGSRPADRRDREPLGRPVRPGPGGADPSTPSDARRRLAGGSSSIALDGLALVVDGEVGVLLPRPPARAAATAADGDVDGRGGRRARRPTTLGAGALPPAGPEPAVIYPLPHTAVLRVALPLGDPPPRRPRGRGAADRRRVGRHRRVPGGLPAAEQVAKGWEAQTRRRMR